MAMWPAWNKWLLGFTRHRDLGPVLEIFRPRDCPRRDMLLIYFEDGHALGNNAKTDIRYQLAIELVVNIDHFQGGLRSPMSLLQRSISDGRQPKWISSSTCACVVFNADISRRLACFSVALTVGALG